MKFIKSIQFALNGILHAAKYHTNFRIQLLIALIVFIAGQWIGLLRFEWAVIYLNIGLVAGLELINSSIEEAMNHLHPEHHKNVGKIKDMAAGAVLLASICAAISGIYIFLPRVLALL